MEYKIAGKVSDGKYTKLSNMGDLVFNIRLNCEIIEFLDDIEYPIGIVNYVTIKLLAVNIFKYCLDNLKMEEIKNSVLVRDILIFCEKKEMYIGDQVILGNDVFEYDRLINLIEKRNTIQVPKERYFFQTAGRMLELFDERTKPETVNSSFYGPLDKVAIAAGWTMRTNYHKFDYKKFGELIIDFLKSPEYLFSL